MIVHFNSGAPGPTHGKAFKLFAGNEKAQVSKASTAILQQTTFELSRLDLNSQPLISSFLLQGLQTSLGLINCLAWDVSMVT